MARHHSRSHPLVRVTHKPRQFGYLLAALILATISPPTPYLQAWMIALLLYPVLMSRLLNRWTTPRAASSSMLCDGLLVGLLISLVGFNLEVTVVLLSLLLISCLVIGGLPCLLLVLPMSVFGVVTGTLLHPDSFVGGESFYLVSFVALIAYVIFVGLLVFEETKQLKHERCEARAVSSEHEQFRRWIAPFLPEPLRLPKIVNQPAERKRLTVFFCDIAGFTRLMDTMDELLVADLLNDYFTRMTHLATRYGGTVDKFIGDGIMIFFGDSVSPGPAKDAEACVSMAIDMREQFRSLSHQWSLKTMGPALHLRMGIHSGYCLVGNFGCSERREYTALGSVVNLASRLESHAGEDEILVSLEIVRLLGPRLRVSPRGLLTIRGFRKPIPAWSVRELSNPCGEVHLQLLQAPLLHV